MIMMPAQKILVILATDVKILSSIAMIMITVPLTPVIARKGANMKKLNVMTTMLVPMMTVILIQDVLTQRLTAMTTMLVPLIVVIPLLDVPMNL
jgi:hypothetical protein